MGTRTNPAANCLSQDVELKGALGFVGEMTFDGKLEGDIVSEGTLTLGENAVINGNVNVGSVVVLGHLKGSITATDRIEIRDNSEVFGDITTSCLIIEEGATFVGRSKVHAKKVTPPEPSPRRSAAAEDGR